MRLNFKKVSAIAASALMAGMTMGTAMAANYPAPFVVSGSADVAVAYGTGAGVSSLDLVQAGNIQSSLQSHLGGSSSTPDTVTGDSVLLERAATKFNLGRGVLDVVSGTLTEDDLSNVLKDGKYLDNDNDEREYTQKIVLANTSLSLFDDSDYKSDTPTVGIRVGNGNHIANYTLEFASNPEFIDLSNTNLEMMGKSYFISSVVETSPITINLLDAANTASVAEGETKNVNVGTTSYAVTISSLSGSASSPTVKLSVNGQVTNSLAEGQTYKLTDGTYVGIKDISMRDVAGTTSSVEFSLGTGKIELKEGVSVKMNDKTISGLTGWMTNGTGATLGKIILEWKADDDSFATEDSSIILPGLENVKLSYSGMVYPKTETFTVEKGSSTYVSLKNFPLKSGTKDIDLMYGNGSTWFGTGRAADQRIAMPYVNATSLIYDGDIDEYFIATYNDGNNAESYLMRATSFSTKSDGNQGIADIEYYSDGSWVAKKTGAGPGDSISIGSVSLTVGNVSKITKQVWIAAGTSVNFATLYSKEGLKVDLNNSLTGLYDPGLKNGTFLGFTGSNVTGPTTLGIAFLEETRTGALTGGNAFNVTLGWTSSKATVTAIVGEQPDGGLEIGDTDVMRSFVYGPLATEILFDTSGDQDSAEVRYHGEESYGKVYVSEIGATITAGSGSTTSTQLGDVLVKDSEVSSVSSKNLIVVGGSCINSVAANVLGGASCSADFTAKTGIGSGQFLIQSFASPYASGKVALLVSGYEAADTVNAATYLRTQTVDTAVGKKYQGTSATTATLVTTSA